MFEIDTLARYFYDRNDVRILLEGDLNPKVRDMIVNNSFSNSPEARAFTSNNDDGREGEEMSIADEKATIAKYAREGGYQYETRGGAAGNMHFGNWKIFVYKEGMKRYKDY